MTIRNLCYRHNCQQFDKLPDALRPVAAEWCTVPPAECEMCQEKKVTDLRAALEKSKLLLERLRVCNRDFINEIDEVCEQARAALADAGEAGE